VLAFYSYTDAMTGMSNSVEHPERLSFLQSLEVQECIVLTKS